MLDLYIGQSAEIRSCPLSVLYNNVSIDCINRSIGPFNASDDLPIDCEDALLVWINKVSTACVKHTQTLRQQQALANHSTVSLWLLLAISLVRFDMTE